MDDNIFTSFRDALRARIGMPIIFTFFFSWVVVNSKYVIALLFGSNTLTDTAITEHVYDRVMDIWLPLILTVIFTLVLPYIQYLFTKLGTNAEDLRKDIKSTNIVKDHQRRTKEYEEEVKQDKEYLRKVRDNNLNNWVKERATLQAELEQEKKDHEAVKKQYAGYRDEREESLTVKNLEEAKERLAKISDDLAKEQKINASFKQYLDGKMSFTPLGLTKIYMDLVNSNIKLTQPSVVKELQKMYDNEYGQPSFTYDGCPMWDSDNNSALSIQEKFVDLLIHTEPELREDIAQRIIGGKDFLGIVKKRYRPEMIEADKQAERQAIKDKSFSVENV